MSVSPTTTVAASATPHTDRPADPAPHFERVAVGNVSYLVYTDERKRPLR